MPHLSLGDIRVHYREIGAGSTVVLLHGGGSSGAQWRDVCARLAAHRRAVTVDVYGHGGTSPWPGAPERRTHEADAELVRAVIREVGGAPIDLVGHSYGGGVAIRLVVADPTAVRTLVLLEPQIWSMLRHGGEPAYYEENCRLAHRFIADVKAGRAEEAWRAFIDANDDAGAWSRLPSDARARMVAMTDAIVSGYHANLSHGTTPDECRAIRVPTLLLMGSRTFPRHRRMTEIVAAHIPGARLEVVPDAGHMSPVTHPDAVAAAIEAHLRGATR